MPQKRIDETFANQGMDQGINQGENQGMDQDMNQAPPVYVILELTQNMLQVAQAEDWQTLASLEETRQNLIATLFAQPLSGARAMGVADAIRTVLAMDQKIIALSEAGRQQAADGMRQLHQAHRAMRAYANPS